ncbi:MAG TPA: toprim domain-containing protein [Acidimicrobiia bacterium]|nr:toprim domain-containing protein [Acidimicrobiia bacterium]
MSHVDRIDLRRRVDLAGLLDSLTASSDRHQRRRWRCLDPDHEDRHPSVSMRVVDGIGRWRCWSCGRGGTAIDALVAAHGVTVGVAIVQLAAVAHLDPLPHDTIVNEPVPLHPSVEDYVDACQRILRTRTGLQVLEWLIEERRLDPAVLNANRVGADPGPNLLRRRFGLPRSGVAAVLPALDPTGGLSYVQARYLDSGAGTKYGNPTRRLGTNPGLAWPHIPSLRQPDLLIVCEGVLDALTAATAGLPAVAVLGAAYPSMCIAQTIADHTGHRQILIGFDGDDPGRVAADRLQQLLAARGLDARILDLPDGTDLNTLAQATPDWDDHLLCFKAVSA